MDLSALLYSFGLSGFFSSRAFLPAFATAVALKYGDKIPYLKSLDFIQSAAETPMWFTHPIVLWGLGALALAELVGEKSPEIRALLDEGSVYVKTAVSAATSFGLLSAADAEAIQEVISYAGMGDLFPAVLTGGVTYVFSSTRRSVMSILSKADEDDSLGIRRFLSWCEEIWALFGVWILLVIPFVVAILIGLVFGVLWLIQKRHERKMEAAKVECPSCRTRIHPFATSCYSCNAELSDPIRLGFLGGYLDKTEANPTRQRIRLMELRRSPKSGDRPEGTGIDAVCETDGVRLFEDPVLNRRYVDAIDSRLLKVMFFGGLLSLIPGIGLIIGVVYYRFQLVAPYRRHLPFGKGLAIKWLIKLLFLVLVLLQFIPVLGGFVVPVMAFINHRFYRSAFLSALKEAGRVLA